MGVSAQRKAALRCIRNSKNRIGEWLHSSSFFLCVLESHSLIGHPVGYFAVPADSRRTHRDSKNDRGHGDLPPTASIAFTLEEIVVDGPDGPAPSLTSTAQRQLFDELAGTQYEDTGHSLQFQRSSCEWTLMQFAVIEKE